MQKKINNQQGHRISGALVLLEQISVGYGDIGRGGAGAAAGGYGNDDVVEADYEVVDDKNDWK